MYQVENYKGATRYSTQRFEILRFLQAAADGGYNEHFHWGRFEWMMAHPDLDVEMLPEIALFRDESDELVGVVMYDGNFDDRWYILHSISDEGLLQQMVEYVTKIDVGATTIKANLNDAALCKLLENLGYKQQYSGSVLQMNLSRNLSFQLPQGFCLNTPSLEIDNWQWRLVIHRGFDNDGIPQAPSAEVAKAQKHLEGSEYIKVFAIKDGEYIAHCGVWYHGGDTAYIEPVATVPEYRGKGLGKAVVYEAVNRAKEQGAKRAIVLSDQKFYLCIGMAKSSEVGTWVKNSH